MHIDIYIYTYILQVRIFHIILLYSARRIFETCLSSQVKSRFLPYQIFFNAFRAYHEWKTSDKDIVICDAVRNIKNFHRNDKINFYTIFFDFRGFWNAEYKTMSPSPFSLRYYLDLILFAFAGKPVWLQDEIVLLHTPFCYSCLFIQVICRHS